MLGVVADSACWWGCVTLSAGHHGQCHVADAACGAGSTFYAVLPLQRLALLVSGTGWALNTCEILMCFDKQQPTSIACV